MLADKNLHLRVFPSLNGKFSMKIEQAKLYYMMVSIQRGLSLYASWVDWSVHNLFTFSPIHFVAIFRKIWEI